MPAALRSRRKWLPEPTWEAEREFWQQVCGEPVTMFLQWSVCLPARDPAAHLTPRPSCLTPSADRCRVILTPGKDCHAAEPGFFRLCFAWMKPEALPEAVRRIKLLMGSGAAGGASDCTVQ